MIKKRLEIYKNSTWLELELERGSGIKYNNVINKIAKTSDRSISGSNTFKLPITKQNIDNLGINIFNPTDMAIALNQKYEARYYIDDVLSKEGFVVINNINRGVPSLNFVDKSVTLLKEWGETTYKELLQDDTKLLNLDSDYIDAIDDIKDHATSRTSTIVVTSNIDNNDFPICYFPNTINTIGDKFNVVADDLRADDYFNPYQSRPIFNAMAFLEIITQAYGYTLVKDDSIDWNKMAITIITDKDLNKAEIEDVDTATLYPTIEEVTPYWYTDYVSSVTNEDERQSGLVVEFPSEISYTPSSVGIPETTSDLPHVTKQSGGFAPYGQYAAWDKRCICQVQDFNGSIRITADFVQSYDGGDDNTSGPLVYGVWYDSTNYANFLYQNITITDDSTDTTMEITIAKSLFVSNAPTNAGNFLGFYVSVYAKSLYEEGNVNMYNVTIEEDITPQDVITFDDHGQIEQDSIDLTYFAPKDTIRKTLVGILQKFGALIDIDVDAEEVTIFNYNLYGTNRYAGNFYNWSDYHQKMMPSNFNTNYGNQYAVKNKIGLKDPFPGNYNETYLGNQVSISKLKEYGEDFNSLYSDVSKRIYVEYTNNSYNEFSIDKKASMLEDSGTVLESIGSLAYNVDAGDVTTQSNLTNVPIIWHSDHSTPEDGVYFWYQLIDDSVRAKPYFLLPQDVIKNFDIKYPIYVEELGGFYIVEQILGYEDSSKPVQIELIKLPSTFGTDDAIETLNGAIAVSFAVVDNDPWQMYWNYSTIDWTGNSLTGVMIPIDTTGNFDDSSDILTYDLDTNSSLTIQDIAAEEEGYYEVYVVDNNGIESYHGTVSPNDTSTYAPTISISKVNGYTDTINTVAELNYSLFISVTTLTLYAQKWDADNLEYKGTQYTQSLTIPSGADTETVSYTFPDSGYWRLWISNGSTKSLDVGYIVE